MAVEIEQRIVPAAEEHTPLYTFGRKLAGLLVKCLFPVKYHQPERLDMDAPYILMANHQSLLDPFALAYPCKKYEIRFLGKKEITKNKVLGSLVTKIHMIPVDRHHTDLSAMRSCSKVLKEGKVLGIFPEGTRHHEDLMSSIETGTAVLALRSGVPLIPVYFDQKLKLFRRINVYVGNPMDVTDLRKQGFDAEQVEKLTARIKDTFLSMRADTQKS